MHKFISLIFTVFIQQLSIMKDRHCCYAGFFFTVQFQQGLPFLRSSLPYWYPMQASARVHKGKAIGFSSAVLVVNVSVIHTKWPDLEV